MKKNIKILIISSICIIGLILLICVFFFIYINKTYISKEEVKKIIINDTKLNNNDISFKEIELDLEDETKKYDVEFYYNRNEYKYEIDAKTGNIIYSNFFINNNSNNSNNNNYISMEEAKNIALMDSGFSNNEVVFTDIDLDLKNGNAIYEVDFKNNTLEYEYKIDGINKKIISKNQELIELKR